MNSNMLNSASIMNVNPTQAYGITDGSGIFEEHKKKNNYDMYLQKQTKGQKKSVPQSNQLNNGVLSSRTHDQGNAGLFSTGNFL